MPCEWVHLDYAKYAERSPFELSGGQTRRVAIAGVLAMEAEVLILDEPTAGLDPRGTRAAFWTWCRSCTREGGVTVIMVSPLHGRHLPAGDPAHRDEPRRTGRRPARRGRCSRHVGMMESVGLGVPAGRQALRTRCASAGVDLPDDLYTIDAVTDACRSGCGKEAAHA